MRPFFRAIKDMEKKIRIYAIICHLEICVLGFFLPDWGWNDTQVRALTFGIIGGNCIIYALFIHGHKAKVDRDENKVKS